MADEDRLELELDEAPRQGVDADDMSAAIAACTLLMADDEWLDSQTLEFDGIRWQPHLVAGTKIVHISLSGELRGYLRKRLAAARLAGFDTVLATTVDLLYDFDVLEFLVENEIQVAVIDYSLAVTEPKSALVTIAYELEVTEEERRRLARIGWDQCQQRDVDSATKGKRLEGLLAFLLSQIDGLEIKNTNVSTATEELDVVVRQRALDGRSWRLPGAPLIIAEAKNWHTQKAGQKEFSAFYMKLLNKRRSVRLGLFVCTLGFSKKAKMQELRGSRDEIVVAFVGPQELDAWVGAESGDDCFEDLIEGAMLR